MAPTSPLARATSLTPTATPSPTITPTPTPVVLSFNRYQAPGDTFSVQVPDAWKAQQIGGGVEFRQGDEPMPGITAYYQPLAANVDATAFLTSYIASTLATIQANDFETFRVLRDETLPSGSRLIEYTGRLQPQGPPIRVRSELWLEDNTLLGLSLAAPTQLWPQLEGFWPIVRQSYLPNPGAGPQAGVGAAYVQPSSLFTITAPAGWSILEEEASGVTLADASGLARFSIAASETDRSFIPKDYDEMLNGLLGDLPRQDAYQEFERSDVNPNGRLVQFEAPTNDGFYRTELRTFSGGRLLYTSSFSAPPQDWDLYAPAYQQLLGSLQMRTPPPDEATQDADPLAGIEAGTPRFYRSGGLWVSAPIYNYRSRNISDLTAAVQLFDDKDNLLGAESWRLEQDVVPAGGVTYLTKRISPEVAPLDRVSYVRIEPVLARDTREKAPGSWEYVAGAADLTSKGNIDFNVTLRNTTGVTRRYMVVTALLYDREHRPVFAHSQTKRLPYPVEPGELVDLRLVVPGPLPTEVVSFDVVGEVMRQ